MAENEVKTLRPVEAWQLLHDNPRAVLVDVRSTMEFRAIGHPIGAVHIPWIDEPDWEVNRHFVKQVRQLILGGSERRQGPDAAPILLICRSGYRSHDAATLLVQHGFEAVYNITEGFEGELDEHHHRSSVGGWRFHGLPWEQC
ncbi:MAG: rhodanese-like domain-containing protein [Gammaproteobacteria bacterium]|nr:rhodanese-like domain-containing protein [Gammaproteobacteria bacterium]